MVFWGKDKDIGELLLMSDLIVDCNAQTPTMFNKSESSQPGPNEDHVGPPHPTLTQSRE